jgi:hypothetical protein
LGFYLLLCEFLDFYIHRVRKSNNADVLSARILFDAMLKKNLVFWNAMISRYYQNKETYEALKLFMSCIQAWCLNQMK